MASLSAQIAGLSSSQKTQLSTKLKPMLGPLTAMVPFAAPLIMSMVNSAPGALAMVIKPVEPLLPAQAKSMIQKAITQVMGSSTTRKTTRTRTPVTRTRTPVVRSGATVVPGIQYDDQLLGGIPWKYIGVGAIVLGGIYFATRKK
jgi:hypothetical protein